MGRMLTLVAAGVLLAGCGRVTPPPPSATSPAPLVSSPPLRPRVWPGPPRHPTLAVPRADGSVVLNDDFRDRVLLLDPHYGRVLWQYGVTDGPGSGPGHLFIPDGLDQLAPGVIPGT